MRLSTSFGYASISIYFFANIILFSNNAIAADFIVNPFWTSELERAHLVFPEYWDPFNDPESPPGRFVDQVDLHIHMSGPIRSGDTNKLLKLMKFSNPMISTATVILSLNSPGGDFGEAIKLMDLLKRKSVRTLVWRNHQCLSSCAFVFLSGIYETRMEQRPHRYLHISGRLGFHSPFESKSFIISLFRAYASISSDGEENLTLEEFEELNAELVALRQNAIEELIYRSERLDIEQSFLFEVLNTGPSDTLYLSSIRRLKDQKIMALSDWRLAAREMDEFSALSVCELYYYFKYSGWTNFGGHDFEAPDQSLPWQLQISEYRYNSVTSAMVEPDRYGFYGTLPRGAGPILCSVVRRDNGWIVTDRWCAHKTPPQQCLRDNEEYDHPMYVTEPMKLGLDSWIPSRSRHQTYLAVSSPSFTCSAAAQKDEHAICANAELARLDRQVALWYRSVRVAIALQSSEREKLNSDLISTQRSWLRSRRDCEEDFHCLFRQYRERIADLESWWRNL